MHLGVWAPVGAGPRFRGPVFGARFGVRLHRPNFVELGFSEVNVDKFRHNAR
jgi:hypothetical protein